MSESVAIVQLATPNIDSYAKYSIASVQQYCQKYGYKHFLQRSKTVEDMHINWTKIDLLKEALKLKVSRVVLFDADTVIADHSQSIESFISRYADDNTEILMPRGTYFAFGKSKKRRPPRKLRPNAGFIIVKNHTIGKQIINDWMNAARGEGSIYNDIHPRNQLVYWNFVMPNYLDQQKIFPDHITSNAKNDLFGFFKPTPFLYHIMMSDDKRRMSKMNSIYHKFNENKYLEATTKFLEINNKGFIEVTNDNI